MNAVDGSGAAALQCRLGAPSAKAHTGTGRAGMAKGVNKTMPKGDREILKADPEDGTTPIANLLLEALVIAKLTSKERAAVLFLIRRTYGWQINGNRLKTATIPLSTWTKVLQFSEATRASKVLASLERKKVLFRRWIGPGKGYVYSINTRVALWDNCLNVQLLSEITTQGLSESARVELSESATPLATNLAIGKERLNKGKESNTDIRDLKEIRISGQSIETSMAIVKGEKSGISQKKIEFFKKELERLGLLPEECNVT